MTARAEREAGFTIIEMVVAALVLAMGALATFGMLSAATKNTYRAKQTQVALDMAQQEMEALRSLSSREVALTGAPESSANTMSPNYRVKNGTFALKNDPPSEYRNLVVNGGELYGATSEEEKFITGGVINPGPSKFTSGDLTGTIYRYVVWRNDEKCSETKCPGAQDYKQVIVAVKMDQTGNLSTQRGYTEVQSDFIDPLDSKAKDPTPGPGGTVVTAQQFYLTDTPCSPTGSTTRQEVTGDHLLHNTLGTCANGVLMGATKESEKGAPDALVLGAPPDPDPENISIPEQHDYSEDSFFPVPSEGLEIRRDGTSGCHFSPTGTNQQSLIHRWVSDPMPSNFRMTKNVTLELYTQTLDDRLYPARLCAYLFKRQEVGPPTAPVATDSYLVDPSTKSPFWTYTPTFWPRGEWTRIRVKMTFSGAPITIPAGQRLGLGLSVERAGTENPPYDAIAVMYDHPLYASRIEVDTDTPIGG